MKLVLSTSNVMQGGPSIIRRHHVERSNVELVASLRTNILAAQEAALEEASSSDGDVVTNGSIHGATQGGAHRPPITAWTSRDDGTIQVPPVVWSWSGLAEERHQYDITVKLFFLPHVSPTCRRAQTLEAVDLVLRELKVPSIDLLILSFPGMAFHVKDEVEGHRPKGCGDDHDPSHHDADTGEVEEMGTMIKTWRTVEQLHAQGIIGRLGVAEFGSRQLQEFLPHAKIRPSVNQINVRDCCTVPRSLMAFAKREHMELLTHNDCTNILPTGTLRELLGDGPDGVGFLAGSSSVRGDGLVADVEAQWVVKYTAVVRDRGVVENKGYFAVAQLDPH